MNESLSKFNLLIHKIRTIVSSSNSKLSKENFQWERTGRFEAKPVRNEKSFIQTEIWIKNERDDVEKSGDSREND